MGTTTLSIRIAMKQRDKNEPTIKKENVHEEEKVN